jgi:hypothetical protein
MEVYHLAQGSGADKREIPRKNKDCTGATGCDRPNFSQGLAGRFVTSQGNPM